MLTSKLAAVRVLQTAELYGGAWQEVSPAVGADKLVGSNGKSNKLAPRHLSHYTNWRDGSQRNRLSISY